MKKERLKRRYLLQNPKEVVRYLATSSYKKAIEQLYVEKESSDAALYAVIAVCFRTQEHINAFETELSAYGLCDVSEDKRYKNRYLSLFGLPQTYDFSLEHIFKKLDKIGFQTFDFAFARGMSTQKVLKVLLYRQMQFLENEVALLLDDDAKAPLKLAKRAENIDFLLDNARVIFDEAMRERLRALLEPFFSQDRACLLTFVQSELYATLLLDMNFFLNEQSCFYLLKKSEMPIFFFVKKYLKKEEFRIARRLKKALY